MKRTGFNLIHKGDLANLLAGLLQAHLDAPGLASDTPEVHAYSAGYIAALKAVAVAVGVKKESFDIHPRLNRQSR